MCRLAQEGVAAKEALAADPAPSGRQRRDLQEAVIKGADAETALVRGHHRLIIYLAARSLGPSSERKARDDDVFQEALMAFVLACRKFDPSRGKLSTYAAYPIRQAISRLALDATTVGGSHAVARGRSLVRSRDRFREHNGRDPSPGELAEVVNRAVVARYELLERAKPGGVALPDSEVRIRAERAARRWGLIVSPQQVIDLIQAGQSLHSMDRAVPGVEDTTFGELIAGDDSVEDTVLDSVEADERSRALRQALDALMADLPMAVDLICLHFGLDGRPPMPLKTAAAAVGVPANKAPDLLSEALHKLADQPELSQLAMGR